MAYVLVALAPITWQITLVFLDSKESSHVWDRFLHEYLRYFPGTSKITVDGGQEFSEIKKQCNLMQISVHVTAAYHPQSNMAEGGVKRFSKVFKLFLNGTPGSWRKSLSYMQILLNTCFTSPHTGLPPYISMGGGQSSGFYNPYLTFHSEKEPPNPPERSNEAYCIMQRMSEVLRDKYGLFACPYRGSGQTFEGLGITEGTTVYFREFAPAQKGVVGLAKILPKFSIGIVEKLLSRTVAYIRSRRTDRIICRHVTDCVKAVPPRVGPELPFMSHLEQISKEESGADLETDLQAIEASKAEIRNLKNMELTQNDVREVPKLVAEQGAVAKKPSRSSRRKKGLAPENTGL